MAFIARTIVRFRRQILLAALIVLVPSLYGLSRQRIEYDLMTYLPAESPAAVGQRILNDHFDYGSTAFLLIEDHEDWQVEQLKQRVAEVPGVRSVAWIDDLADIAVPKQYLDPALIEQFFRDRATALQVVFANPGSTIETCQAVAEIQSLLDEDGMMLTGQTVALAEMRALADAEKPRMLLISLAMVLAVLLLAMPSPAVPFIFLATLGFAVAVNLGLNYFLGFKLSYLTNSVAVALQLGVTLDFCIFLWERYREERRLHDSEQAMGIAIRSTATAVLASAVTTVFGFLALAAMRNGLGADLGITLARGVLFSLVACLTILPSLLLFLDKYILAWQHRSIVPGFEFLARLVPKLRIPLFLLFLLLFIPARYGYDRVQINYDVESTYPSKLQSIKAAQAMRKTFGTADSLNLVTKGIEPYELENVLIQLEDIPGVTKITAYSRMVDPAIPSSFVPDEIKRFFVAGEYTNSTLMLSERATAESTAEILAAAEEILRPYRGQAFLTGQAAISSEMASLAKMDLPRVNTLSLVLVFLTLAVSFCSFSLPVILILAIQLAIWFNQGIAYYAGREIFFFGTVAIGAIQLGATVDYAVLLTARFREELRQDNPVAAMSKAWRASSRAIITSASTLVAATMGIYLGTSMDLVRDLIVLIARGAFITLAVVLLVLPAVLLVLNRLIGLTTRRWPAVRGEQAEQHSKGVPSPCTGD